MQKKKKKNPWTKKSKFETIFFFFFLVFWLQLHHGLARYYFTVLVQDWLHEWSPFLKNYSEFQDGNTRTPNQVGRPVRLHRWQVRECGPEPAFS